MPSSDKLIKQGIKYTDSLFAEISKRLEAGVKASDTLEAFLDATKEYTAKNPLISSGYDETMLRLILSETNNHKFSRPSQKELARVTIENKVGDLIVDVGEDIKESVREIVKDGYNQNLSQDEIAANISNRVNVIKNKRARAIARTEIARTATVSDYIINKERGATHFYVECRNTACPICKEAWHKHWSKANDESFKPKDQSAGGRGWIGDRTYSMEDTAMLPPIHPNSYHKDTQVYTENGWRYIADLTGNEKLLSLHPDDESLEFIKPVRLFKHKEPELVHMHNKWFDVCVTPDHDCFIHQRRDGGKKGRYFEPQFRKPHELTGESRFLRCIDTDRVNPDMININGLEFEPEDFAFFMAWFISEGSVLHDKDKAKKRGYPIFIAQEISENREIIQPVLENICNYLGLRLNITKNQFVIYSKELYDYLLPLGYSYEKYIPSEVFTLNKQCLNIFLDNYVLGDGHERQCSNELVQNSSDRCVFTSSKRLRDDLSYLILLCGYYPSIALHTKAGTVTTHKNGTYTQNHDVYRISINKSKYTTFSSCTVDIIPYDDYTYCVELPKYHTLWVMRNGKTSWNGNCRCVPYFISEDDVDGPVEPVLGRRPTTTETTETKPVPLELNSNYKEYDETLRSGRQVTIREYENGFKISIDKEHNITHDDIVNHIQSLPKPLQDNIKLKSIDMYSDDKNKGGYSDILNKITLWNKHETELSQMLDTLTHELAHAFDYQQVNEVNRSGLSIRKVYDKIFEADSKLKRYTNPDTGEVKYYPRFPSDYAKRSWDKFKKQFEKDIENWKKSAKKGLKPQDDRYIEDFSESSRLYLNPLYHDAFVKEFPNRAKYLEGLYGKPKFDKNSPLYKALKKEGKI